MRPYYEDEAVQIFHADCMDVLPTLGTDLTIVSDPPYGMDWNTDMTRFSGGSNGLELASRGRDWPRVTNDAQPFDPAPFLTYPAVVLWGVNHFAERVPVGTWLVWLKKPAVRYGAFLSDAEVAWKKGGHGIYAREYQWEGLNRAEERGNHLHPTQKPVTIMRWCIDMAGGDAGATICDPFCGSGPTLRASKDMGRRAIGIEIEERYCEIAAERCRQGVLDFRVPANAPEGAQK